jgi:hypothetical protein
MGTVEWFLGIHFQWKITPSIVQVHLSQTGFASQLVEDHNTHTRQITPDATPYRSGLPIDAIPELMKMTNLRHLLNANVNIKGFFWLACSMHTINVTA